MSQASVFLHSTYVNGTPEVIGQYHGRSVISSLRKRPVPGEQAFLDTNGFTLDSQADLEVHGGPEKAVYAWPMTHYDAWAAESGTYLLEGATPHDPYHGGHFGENLLVVGEYADEQKVNIGDVWSLGELMLQVTQPREPCFKLGTAIHRAGAWMVRTGRCGWYLKLVSPPGLVPAYGTHMHLLQVGEGPTVAEAFATKMRRNKGRVHGPRD